MILVGLLFGCVIAQEYKRTNVYSGGGASSTQIDPVNGLMFVGASGNSIRVMNLTTKTYLAGSFSIGGPGIAPMDWNEGWIVAAKNSEAVAGYVSPTGVFSGYRSWGNVLIPRSVCKFSGSSYFVVSTSSLVFKYDTNAGGIVDSTNLLLSGDVFYTRELNANYIIVDSGGASGHFIHKATFSVHNYYNPSTALGTMGIVTDPSTGRFWSMVNYFCFFCDDYRLHGYNSGGGSSYSTFASRAISSSYEGMEVMKNYNLILVRDGSSLILYDMDNLTQIAWTSQDTSAGSIDWGSLSKEFFYDKYTEGGWLFGYTAGGTLKIGIIKQPCFVANCFSCGVDRTKYCEKCNLPSYLKNDSTTLHQCVLYASIPLNYGINLTETRIQYIPRCVDLHCDKCIDNYQLCTRCEATWYVLDFVCIQKPQFPPWTGVDLTDFHVKSCIDPGCDNCIDDRTICQQCKPLHYLYLGFCLEKENFPLRFGVNLTNSKVENCNILHCYYCKDDITQCNVCEPGFYFYSPTQSCIDKPNFPPKFGVSEIAVISCADTHCTDCIDTISDCVQCETGWHKYNKGCLDKPNFTPHQGVNTVTNTVLDCTDSHCIDCKDDYSKCVKCDNLPIGSEYYLLPSPNSCLLKSEFPVKMGVDLAGGSTTIVSCSDFNCLNCIDDRTICVSCPFTSGYYLYSNICIQKSQFASYAPLLSLGVDPLDNTVKQCVPPGCTSCVDDINQCKCDDLSGYYWSNNLCIQKPNFPASTGIKIYATAPFYRVEACAGLPECTSCIDDVDKCTQCDQLSAKPYLYLDKCIAFSEIPNGFGPNPLNNHIEPCTSDPVCKVCSADKHVCTRCEETSVNRYLFENKCIEKSQIPAGMGPDDFNVIEACAVAHCTNCDIKAAVCRVCEAGFYIFLEKNDCLPFEKIPDYFGIMGNQITNCYDDTCLDCRANTQKCVVYYQAEVETSQGLKGQVSYDFMYTIRLKRESFNRVAVSDIESNPRILQNYFEALMRDLKVKAVATSTGRKMDPSKIKIVIQRNQDNSFRVLVTLEEPAELDYRLELEIPEISFKSFGITYGTRPINNSGSVHFKEPYVSGIFIPGQKALFNPGELIPLGPGYSNSLLMLLYGSVSIISSGFQLIKFGQFIKLVTKIQFININFGSQLGAFLDTAADSFKPPSFKEDNSLEVYEAVGFKGKISRKKITLDFFRILYDKVAIYALSVAFRVYLQVRYWTKGKPAKFMVVLMYFYPKVHAVLFNLFAIDFLFYGVRPMSHMKLGYNENKYVSTLVICLVSLDIFVLFYYACEHSLWRIKYSKRVRETKMAGLHLSLKQVEELDSSQIKLSTEGCVMTEDQKPEEEKKREAYWSEHPEEGYEYDLDFEASYEVISHCNFYVELLEGPLARSKAAYLHTLPRLHVIINITRASLYQLLIVCGQNVSTSLLAVLTAIELAKLGYHMHTYLKFKYLASVVVFVGECLQSVFLICFFVVCFFLHLADLSLARYELLQKVGIYLIISAVASEYFLLVSGVVVSLVKSSRDGKIKKKYAAKLKEVETKTKASWSKLQNIIYEKSRGPLPYRKITMADLKERRFADEIEEEEWRKHIQRKQIIRKFVLNRQPGEEQPRPASYQVYPDLDQVEDVEQSDAQAQEGPADSKQRPSIFSNAPLSEHSVARALNVRPRVDDSRTLIMHMNKARFGGLSKRLQQSMKHAPHA